MRRTSAAAFVLLAGVAFAPVTARAQVRLFFESDIVRGDQAGAPGPFCVLASQFKRLEKVVFRVRVSESAGQPLDDKGLAFLSIDLPDGQKLQAKYGAHPPPRIGPAADHFWSARWIIPADYPSGTFGYKVTAKLADGTTQTWEPFKMAPSQLTVIAGAIEIAKTEPTQP
jgi:hypothetical protein